MGCEAPARSSSGVRDHRVERLHEDVDGVERSTAEDARMEILLAGANTDMEVDEPPRPDVEGRHARRWHAAVEDQAGIGAALVGRQKIDDRLPARLLLAVGDDPHVDRQRALGRERCRGLEQQVEVALVVAAAPSVDPAVAYLGLERR